MKKIIDSWYNSLVHVCYDCHCEGLTLCVGGRRCICVEETIGTKINLTTLISVSTFINQQYDIV